MEKKKTWLGKVIAVLLIAVMVITIFPQPAKAAGSYFIRINLSTNVVTVYNSANNAPVTAFTCSAGAATQPGTYSTSQKYRWHTLDGPSYGQYCTRIYGGVLFHSVWYYENGNLASQSTREFNKLGTTASHGCIRLTVAAAKWIFDNCPSGTTVVIFRGSAADDPLGKPDVVKVSTASRMGWDPTDPDPANPYGSAVPSISTVWAPREIAYGSVWNPLAGISAASSTGSDITHSITWTGGVNTKRLGSYNVTYSVVDGVGKTASTVVTFTVKDMSKPILKGIPSKRTKEYNSTYNLKKGVSAKAVTGKRLTGKIVVKVKAPGSKKSKVYKKSKLKLSKVGTYRVTYSVKNPANQLSASKVLKITVRDTKPPKLTGVKSTVKVDYNKTVNLRKGIKAKLVSGKNLTSKIVVSVKRPDKKTYTKLSTSKSKKYKFTKLGTYKIRYVSTNPTSKKKTTKYTKYTVLDVSAPKLTVPGTQTKEYNSTINLMTGVSAKYAVSKKSLTSKIKVEVSQPNSGNTYKTVSAAAAKSYKLTKTGAYKVRYTIANPNRTSKKTVKTVTINVVDTAVPVLQTPDLPGTAAVGGTVNLTRGLSAKLVSGRVITNQVAINITRVGTDGKTETVAVGNTGTLNLNKAGTYTVTYTVANPNNKARIAKKTYTIRVEDTTTPDISIKEGLTDTDFTIAEDTPVDLSSYVTFDAYTAGINPKLAVYVKAKDADDSTYVPVPVENMKQYRFAAAGTYTVKWVVTNPNNQKTDEATHDFTVTQPSVSPTGTAPETPDTTAEDSIAPVGEAIVTPDET
ncbi:MAG: DUF5011 domain-containing protein [Eubacterium sp.]|nr:DUF5011 domain-containing protein [Eubacterium sp.]